MSSFLMQLDSLAGQVENLLANPQKQARRGMPCGTYFLDGGEVLALPRDAGDSRYPFGHNGFNFWAYGSGYMHCNEGLFSLFLRAAEGQEPNTAFFAGLPARAGSWQALPLFNVPRMEAPPRTTVTRYCILSPTAAWYLTRCDDLLFGLRVFVTASNEISYTLGVRNHGRPRSSQRLLLSSFFNPYLRHQLYESGEDRWYKEIRFLAGERGLTTEITESTEDTRSNKLNINKLMSSSVSSVNSVVKKRGDQEGAADLGAFQIMVNEDADRLHSFTNYALLRRQWFAGKGAKLVRHEETASRYQYVGGIRGSLHNPQALVDGTLGPPGAPQHLCTFVETAIAGDLLEVRLGGGAAAQVDMLLTRARDVAEVQAILQKPLSPAGLDSELAALDRAETHRQSDLKVHVETSVVDDLEPEVFNAFVEHLKKQVEFCSLIKGYIQLHENALIGIRDVFQAVEALLFWQPQPARAKMLEALGFTCPSGRCFRQYSLPSAAAKVGRMDIRPYIDQGVWVISTLATYLRTTGDFAFLNEICGYHDIEDEPTKKVIKLDYQDSVLEHLVRIMDYLLEHRDPQTGCVRALYGDWNDALDALGITNEPGQAFGTGVTVMATLQVYQNAQEMAEILTAVDPTKHAERSARYRQAAADIENGLRQYAIIENETGRRKIVHGWGDKRSYLVASFRDPDGQDRDGLTSNAFWVLSGLYDKDPAIGPVILEAFKRLDSKYGLKTFEPYFAMDAQGVGRIRKLPAGTAENGATYVHATAFAIMALFRMGRSREAWEQLVKILPFTSLHTHLSQSTFVMPNSYGYNPEKGIDGQNMSDWQTGSSNVVLKLLIRFVFGLEPRLDGLWIQPAAFQPFKNFAFDVKIRGCDLRLRFGDRGAGRRTFTVNGEQRKATADVFMGLEKLWLPVGELKGKVDVVVRQ